MFKLYLYGIEMQAKKTKLGQYGSSNCTFMELKYGNALDRGSDYSVQIVPLWN